MLPLALILALAPGDPLLPNGDFKEWKDGAPVGWTVSIGATSKGTLDSELEPGPEGGILLRGYGETGRWKAVAREVALEPDLCYRLSFEARGARLRRDGGQFDNAFVGIVLPAADGRPVELRVIALDDRPWAPDEVIFRAPPAGKVEVRLFLSKSGSIEARALVLERLRAEDSYEVLVRHMGRYYSHFASKGIDPAAWAEKHRTKAAAAKDVEEWTAATNLLLRDLKDVHTWLRPASGPPIHPFVPEARLNIDAKVLPGAVSGLRVLGQVRGLGLAGTVGNGYGYLAVGSMPSKPEEFAPVLETLDGMHDRPGLVIDLRGNIGGDERRGLEFAARFCEENVPVLYSRYRVRNGPKPTDLTYPGRLKAVRSPPGVRRFAGPVVVLIGPGCVSSGEGLASMMAAITGVTLVGQPTAGASGNPQPVELPNGVVVHFSRWLVELLDGTNSDGTPLEGRGVPPDRVVEHSGEGDPTLEEAIRILDAARAGEKR